jgi:hypothetical protein
MVGLPGMLAKVTCKHPGIKIIGAAYAISDVELDILPL